MKSRLLSTLHPPIQKVCCVPELTATDALRNGVPSQVPFLIPTSPFRFGLDTPQFLDGSTNSAAINAVTGRQVTASIRSDASVTRPSPRKRPDDRSACPPVGRDALEVELQSIVDDDRLLTRHED
jgi:hypothetical protein